MRHIIKRNVEKGLLPTFSYGLVDFEHLYNTLGINGIYETMKTFGYIYEDELGNVYYKDDAMRFGKEILISLTMLLQNFHKIKIIKLIKSKSPQNKQPRRCLKLINSYILN